MFSKNHIAILVAGLTLPIINQATAGDEPAGDRRLEEIKVLAHPLAENGTAQTVSVLSGDEA